MSLIRRRDASHARGGPALHYAAKSRRQLGGIIRLNVFKRPRGQQGIREVAFVNFDHENAQLGFSSLPPAAGALGTALWLPLRDS